MLTPLEQKLLIVLRSVQRHSKPFASLADGGLGLMREPTPAAWAETVKAMMANVTAAASDAERELDSPRVMLEATGSTHYVNIGKMNPYAQQLPEPSAVDGEVAQRKPFCRLVWDGSMLPQRDGWTLFADQHGTLLDDVMKRAAKHDENADVFLASIGVLGESSKVSRDHALGLARKLGATAKAFGALREENPFLDGAHYKPLADEWNNGYDGIEDKPKPVNPFDTPKKD